MHPFVIGQPENEVMPTHPLFNIPPLAAWKVFMYFQKNNYDMYCERNGNGIWGDTSDIDEFFRSESLPTEDRSQTEDPSQTEDRSQTEDEFVRSDRDSESQPTETDESFEMVDD